MKNYFFILALCAFTISASAQNDTMTAVAGKAGWWSTIADLRSGESANWRKIAEQNPQFPVDSATLVPSGLNPGDRFLVPQIMATPVSTNTNPIHEHDCWGTNCWMIPFLVILVLALVAWLLTDGPQGLRDWNLARIAKKTEEDRIEWEQANLAPAGSDPVTFGDPIAMGGVDFHDIDRAMPGYRMHENPYLKRDYSRKVVKGLLMSGRYEVGFANADTKHFDTNTLIAFQIPVLNQDVQEVRYSLQGCGNPIWVSGEHIIVPENFFVSTDELTQWNLSGEMSEQLLQFLTEKDLAVFEVNGQKFLLENKHRNPFVS